MYKELKGQRFFEMNEGKDYLDSNFNVLLNNDSHCMGVGDKYQFQFSTESNIAVKIKSKQYNDNDNGRQFLLQDFENVIDKIEHTKNIVSNYEAFIGGYVEE